MKKLLASIVAGILTLGCLFMVGCSSPAGTYKFDSMSVTMGDTTIELKVGEDFNGMTLTADFYVIELKKDGTGTVAMQGMSTEITWVKEGDIIKMTADGSTQDFTLDGDKISFDVSGTKVTLKKQ